MSTTPTDHLLLSKILPGTQENTWGEIEHQTLDRIDAVLGETTEISTSGGSTTLTNDQELVAIIEVTGTLSSAAEVIFSGRGGFWMIRNATTGDHAVTAKLSTSAGTPIRQGTSQLVFCDGDDIHLVGAGGFIEESEVASGNSINVMGQPSDFVTVTGSATINSFGDTANARKYVRFTGSPTLTHGSSLILPGEENISVVAGDTLVAISDDNGNVRVYAYQRASGLPVVTPTSVVPIGGMVEFGGGAVPSGWLICDGSAVSRSTYADLFSAIGTTFGAGNGTTTFNVPDFRGRVAAGRDNMGGSAADRLSSANSRGNSMGSEAVQLQTTHLPAHSHSMESGGSHSHTYQLGSSTSASGTSTAMKDNASGPTRSTSTNGAHTHTINETGGDTPHNNVQPTLIVDKIIYAGA